MPFSAKALILLTLLAPAMVVAGGPKTEGDDPQKILDESCEVILNVPSPASLGITALPDLKDPRAVREFSRDLRTQLSANAHRTAEDFNAASDRADDSLSAIKSGLVAGGDPNARAIVDLFLEFNRLATRLAPPEKFSPSAAATESNSGIKSVVRFVMQFAEKRGIAAPPTVEQWLAQYAAESPDFIRMRSKIQSALDDVATRSRAAHLEIDRLNDLIDAKAGERVELEALAQKIESEMTELSAEEQENVRLTILTPIYREITVIQDYISGHRTIVLQKRLVLSDSEDVTEEVITAANVALATLKNSAITTDDALTNKRLGEAAMALKDLTRRSLIKTSETLESTAHITANLRATAILSPEDIAENVRLLAKTIQTTQTSIEQQLPNLKERMARYDALSAELSGLIHQVPTARLPQLSGPDKKETP